LKAPQKESYGHASNVVLVPWPTQPFFDRSSDEEVLCDYLVSKLFNVGIYKFVELQFR